MRPYHTSLTSYVEGSNFQITLTAYLKHNLNFTPLILDPLNSGTYVHNSPTLTLVHPSQNVFSCFVLVKNIFHVVVFSLPVDTTVEGTQVGTQYTREHVISSVSHVYCRTPEYKRSWNSLHQNSFNPETVQVCIRHEVGVNITACLSGAETAREEKMCSARAR